MNTFYIDLLSIFLLFLTSVTCFFSLFGKYGHYWILPFASVTILTLVRLYKLIDPAAVFFLYSGRDLYIAMLFPTALLILFFSSLLLQHGIKRSLQGDHPMDKDMPTGQAPTETLADGPVRINSPADRPVSTPTVTTQQIETFFHTLIAQSSPIHTPIRTRFLYILGIKHSGKSTLGRETAARRSLPFFDLDMLILSFCKRSPFIGMTIREIYEFVGVRRFMLLELITMKQFITQYEHRMKPGKDLVILALGGGVCDNKPLIELLQATGSLIYIAAPESTLYTRIMQSGIPPFLDQKDPKGSFHELYAARDRKYRVLCDEMVIAQYDTTIEEGVDRLESTIADIVGDGDE